MNQKVGPPLIVPDRKGENMKNSAAGAMGTLPDNRPSDVWGRLAKAEDRLAIAETFFHYARCVDRKDAEGVASTFIGGGCFCGAQGVIVEGKGNIRRVYQRMLSELASSSHVVGNVQVHFMSECCASASAVFQAWDAYMRNGDGYRKPDCLSFGVYEGLLVKERDGEWRFKMLGIYFSGQLEWNAVAMGKRGEQFELLWPPFEREDRAVLCG